MATGGFTELKNRGKEQEKNIVLLLFLSIQGPTVIVLCKLFSVALYLFNV